MRRRWLGNGAFIAAMLVVIASCGTRGETPLSAQVSSTVPGASTSISAAVDESAAAMAAALGHLVANDHTFGQGPPPFSEYLIQERLDPLAGNATGGSRALRLLTDIERSAIEAAVTEFGPLRWIDDPDAWRTPDLAPTVEGAAILGVGEPEFSEDGALVPVSLWCGGLCGTWLTYRVAAIDGVWRVTGTEGPIAVS